MSSAASALREALACAASGCTCRSNGATHCPAHADGTPSLSVTERDGRVLVHCHAGCEQAAVVDALRERGLWRGRRDLSLRKPFEPSYPSERTAEGFEGSIGSGGDGQGPPASGGLTLEQLAEAKHLPLAHLRHCGLREWHPNLGRTIVVIPYRDGDGREVSIRYRQALSGAQRFFWRKKDKPLPYGLDRLEEARALGWLLVVEGESDAWTGWLYGIPTLGIPGKTTWDPEIAPALHGLAVYIWQEPGAEDFSERIGRDIPDAQIITAPDDIKDISEAHVQGRDVLALLEGWKGVAIPFAQIRQRRAQEELARNAAEAHALLVAPDLVQRIGDAMRAQGYAGDLNPPTLLYLAMTSRLLERPQNIAVVSQSAAGKNRTVDAAARLMPPEAVHLVKAGSPRSLIYTDEDFHERVVIFAEADSIPDEGPAASAVRSLAEDNAMEYEVVERDPKTGKFIVRRIVKPGPTGLLTTSTKSVANQLGTRVLELSLAEDDRQTRDVMRAHASRAKRTATEPADIAPFIAVQRWLALSGARQVEVPFADVLVDLVPAKAVRMRRDFRQLLTCIQASALLHQCQREQVDGWVIASLEDYGHAYRLLAPIFDSLAAEGLTPVVRATIETILPDEEVTEAELSRRLGLSKATIHYRIERAVRGGWLLNGETRKFCPARLRRGAPLPEATSALPTPAQVRAGVEGSNGFRGDASPPVRCYWCKQAAPVGRQYGERWVGPECLGREQPD